MTVAQNIMNTVGAGMGYIANEDATAVDIFQKFLSDKGSNWVQKIDPKDEYHIPGQENLTNILCFEDHIVESLHNNRLLITDVDGVVFKPTWEKFVETFERIASSDYSWILKDLMSSWEVKSGLAANLFIQIWLYGAPVYFG